MGGFLKFLLIFLLTLAFLTVSGFLLAKWVLSNSEVTDDDEIIDIISGAGMAADTRRSAISICGTENAM